MDRDDMKSLWMCLSLVVVSGGIGRAAPASIDETTGPKVLAERPLGTRVWEDVAPDKVLHAANTNKIFLNRCTGSCLVTRGTTDARTNRSSVPNVTQGSLTAFSRGDAVWNNVVSCVKDVFGPFGVEIVTTDPGPNVNHFEIMVAGTPQQLGLSAGVGGISPYNCGIEYIPNSLVFVFDVWGTNVEDICSTAAQEIAHSFRLDHVTDPSDPLTYFGFTGRRRFKDAQLQCGSDCVDADNNPTTPNTAPFGQTCSGTTLMQGAQNHTCSCTGSNTQNSVAVLKSLFGAGIPTPPNLAITQPKTGDNVMPGFPVAAEASDDNGISMVELRINGMMAGSANRIPYVFNAPDTLSDGTHVVEVTAYDAFGATTKKQVQVIIGKPCGKPSDCPLDTDTCVGGRCVPGSGVQGGLGTVCTENGMCASGQCASDNTGSQFCVEQCNPAKDECPDNFDCITAGEGGVCWPGDDDGGGCQSGTGAGVLGLGLSFAALLCSRRRRSPCARC
jgi:hypothetical protein